LQTLRNQPDPWFCWGNVGTTYDFAVWHLYSIGLFRFYVRLELNEILL
jgi:hypothetical protein